MDQDNDLLLKALQKEDELGAVIRAHLYIESHLLQLIDRLIPYPDRLEDTRLNFPQRVDLALALGLKRRFGPPLKALGKIRNDFVHRPDAVLTKKHVTDLYGALHQEDREVVLKVFDRTKSRVRGSNSQTFEMLEPKDKFTLIVVTLRAVLLAADH